MALTVDWEVARNDLDSEHEKGWLCNLGSGSPVHICYVFVRGVLGDARLFVARSILRSGQRILMDSNPRARAPWRNRLLRGGRIRVQPSQPYPGLAFLLGEFLSGRFQRSLRCPDRRWTLLKLPRPSEILNQPRDLVTCLRTLGGSSDTRWASSRPVESSESLNCRVQSITF